MSGVVGVRGGTGSSDAKSEIYSICTLYLSAVVRTHSPSTAVPEIRFVCFQGVGQSKHKGNISVGEAIKRCAHVGDSTSKAYDPPPPPPLSPSPSFPFWFPATALSSIRLEGRLSRTQTIATPRTKATRPQDEQDETSLENWRSPSPQECRFLW